MTTKMKMMRFRIGTCHDGCARQQTPNITHQAPSCSTSLVVHMVNFSALTVSWANYFFRLIAQLPKSHSRVFWKHEKTHFLQAYWSKSNDLRNSAIGLTIFIETKRFLFWSPIVSLHLQTGGPARLSAHFLNMHRVRQPHKYQRCRHHNVLFPSRLPPQMASRLAAPS